MNKSALLKKVDSSIKEYDAYIKDLQKKKSPNKNKKVK